MSDLYMAVQLLIRWAGLSGSFNPSDCIMQYWVSYAGTALQLYLAAQTIYSSFCQHCFRFCSCLINYYIVWAPFRKLRHHVYICDLIALPAIP